MWLKSIGTLLTRLVSSIAAAGGRAFTSTAAKAAFRAGSAGLRSSYLWASRVVRHGSKQFAAYLARHPKLVRFAAYTAAETALFGAALRFANIMNQNRSLGFPDFQSDKIILNGIEISPDIITSCAITREVQNSVFRLSKESEPVDEDATEESGDESNFVDDFLDIFDMEGSAIFDDSNFRTRATASPGGFQGEKYKYFVDQEDIRHGVIANEIMTTIERLML